MGDVFYLLYIYFLFCVYTRAMRVVLSMVDDKVGLSFGIYAFDVYYGRPE